MFGRKSLKWLLLIAALALTLSAISLYAMRSRPVVWRSNKDEAKSTGGPYRSFLNPFRNRDPERPAEAFLKLLTTNNCDKALAPLAFPTSIARTSAAKSSSTAFFHGGWRIVKTLLRK